MRAAGWLAAALSLSAAGAEAQTGEVFNRTGSGARAAGMANAFIAISDDGSAASWNPAGLGQLRRPELSLVTTTHGESLLAQGFRTRDDLSVFSSVGSSYTSTYLDFASLAVPLTIARKPTTFQVAWRSLYALDYRENVSLYRQPLTPQAPPATLFESNADVAGSIDLWSFAAAVKLTTRIALGASFNVWRGDWTEESVTSETPLDGSGPSRFRANAQRNRVQGNSLGLGLLLTFPRWSFGLLHQSPLEGDYVGTGVSRESGSPPAPPGSLEGTVHFPRGLGLGAAWRPAARWTVALDLNWDEWTATTLDPTDGPPVDLFSGLPPELAATRNTLSVNAGAECLLHGEGYVVPLRFGAGWEPQGARSAYTRDSVNYVVLAAGTGYNTNSVKLDAAFQYRWTSYRDGANFGLVPQDTLLPLAVGERSAREWTVKVSVIVRLSDTEKLHRSMRKAFGGS